MLKRKRGLQKYRADWEKLSEFKGWLSPEPKSCYKARCEACDKTLVADITVLRNHSQAKKHVMKTGGTVYEGPLVKNKSKTKLSKSEEEEYDSADDLQMKSLSIKDNEDDYDVGIQSNDYHSTSNYEKVDQKHEDVQCKAIVSKPAPFWKATAVVNGHVTELKLSDYNGRYLVLFFYPQDFSRICPSELIALSDRVSEFRALNTEVVACSVDSYLSHQAWSRTLRSDGGIAIPKMPLLSDPTHIISKSYGCYLPELGHSLRAHYIIDMRGILRHVTINDLPVGRNIGEILRLLEAFQYTDETETLCPADWKPGEPTIS
ncbi:peroxiredoxin-4-like isoform X4 [Adelges cooleyi]|nr:peroxiredoxin-4-like isoform X4 [Adelges cooleyi]